MNITLSSNDIHRVATLTKSNELAIISESGSTLIIAQENDKDISFKNQIILKINSDGYGGQAVITKELLKLIPKNSKVEITENQIKIGSRKINYKSNSTNIKAIKLEKHLVTLSSEEFKEFINLEYAYAKDETRPILCGVCIDNKEIVALDGFRLAVRSIVSIAAEQVIISKELIDVVKKIKPKDTVQIYFDDNYVSFIFGDLEIIGNRVSGTYIKYKSLIPDEFKTEVTVSSSYLLDIIQNYKNAKLGITKFKISKDSINLRSSNEKIIVEDNLKASVEGPDIEVAFNTNYLVDSFKQYTDEVVLKVTSSIQPMIITDNSNKLDLILPVRLSKESR